MRLQSILVLAIALVLGTIAAFFARTYILSQTASTKPATERTIVVASGPLPFGAELTAENLREIPWPAAAMLAGAFSTKAEILSGGRRVVLSAMERNEPVLATKITGPGQRATLSTLIEEGMRAVTVRVDDVRGVAGFVLPNDRVDVVLTRNEDARNNTGIADILLQNVKVLAIDQIATEKADKPTVARAVTLELNAQDSQKVILAQGIGKLSLLLNRAGATAPEATTRVTTSDLSPADALDKGISTVAKEAPVILTPTVPHSNRVVNVVRDGNRREQYSVTTETR